MFYFLVTWIFNNCIKISLGKNYLLYKFSWKPMAFSSSVPISLKDFKKLLMKSSRSFQTLLVPLRDSFQKSMRLTIFCRFFHKVSNSFVTTLVTIRKISRNWRAFFSYHQQLFIKFRFNFIESNVDPLFGESIPLMWH